MLAAKSSFFYIFCIIYKYILDFNIKRNKKEKRFNFYLLENSSEKILKEIQQQQQRKHIKKSV